VLRAACAELLKRRGVHPVIPARRKRGRFRGSCPAGPPRARYDRRGRRRARRPTPCRRPRALRRAGIAPLVLEAKEGLTLLNGTQHMTAVGGPGRARRRESPAGSRDIAGAMSLEGRSRARSARSTRRVARRPPPTPARSRSVRCSASCSPAPRSPSRTRTAGKVQEPVLAALACRRFHGASRDVPWASRRTVLEREGRVRRPTNPLVFVDTGEMISGGKLPTARPVALALDAAAIAVAELANISERRIEQLVNPHLSSGPGRRFLAPDSGLHSGFMIAQVSGPPHWSSENKILAHPASVDSIPVVGGTRGTHVSMGATLGAQARDDPRPRSAPSWRFELLCAAQGHRSAPARSRPTLPLEAIPRRDPQPRVPAMMVDRPDSPLTSSRSARLIDSGRADRRRPPRRRQCLINDRRSAVTGPPVPSSSWPGSGRRG